MFVKVLAVSAIFISSHSFANISTSQSKTLYKCFPNGSATISESLSGQAGPADFEVQLSSDQNYHLSSPSKNVIDAKSDSVAEESPTAKVQKVSNLRTLSKQLTHEGANLPILDGFDSVTTVSVEDSKNLVLRNGTSQEQFRLNRIIIGNKKADHVLYAYMTKSGSIYEWTHVCK